jgi:hypothetical protein
LRRTNGSIDASDYCANVDNHRRISRQPGG